MAHLASTAPTSRRPRARWRLSPLTRTNLLHGLIFISPWIIGVSLFIAYPILASLGYSFTD